jgi:1-acyl-sn-glycerol-3-phosphate acyltransferase
LARLLVRMLFTLFFTRCKVHGRSRLPGPGRPYILALNRASILDLPLVWAYHPDPVCFLADGDLADSLARGSIWNRVGRMLLSREKLDAAAIDRGVHTLTSQRRNLAIFTGRGARRTGSEPDGPDGGLRPPSGSADDACARLAARARVPVVPAFIRGADEIMPASALIPTYTSRLALVIGEPLDLALSHADPGAEELARATEQIRARIAALNPDQGDPP